MIENKRQKREKIKTTELSKVNSYKAFLKSAQHITYIFFLVNQQAFVRDLMYKSILSSIGPLKYLRELKRG